MIDATREEIDAFLGQYVDSYEANKSDTESAIYWLAYNWHGGESSNLYKVLSLSPYSPESCETDVTDSTLVARILYDLLKVKYCR